MAHHVLRFAAGTDVGRRRAANEDAAFAGPRLLAVADGMGGHPHGDVASGTVIAALADTAARPAGGEPADPAAVLVEAVAEAAARLDGLGRRDPGLREMGTTLTAMAFDGTRLAVAHIGDSRAYLLRDDVLTQLTRDHTMVQSLVDGGRLTPQEAAHHPRGSVLLRALQSGGGARPDVFRHDPLPGDRYLLCSDGVSGVVPPEAIHAALAGAAEPEGAVAALIELADGAGGPDNITCVIADVVPASAGTAPQEPFLLGAARTAATVTATGTAADTDADTAPAGRLRRLLRRT